MELNQLLPLLQSGNMTLIVFGIAAFLLYRRFGPTQPKPAPTPPPQPQPQPAPNDRPLLNTLGLGRLGPLLDMLGIPALGRGGVFQAKAEPDPVERAEKLNTFYTVLELAAESPEYAAAITETAARIAAAKAKAP